MSKAKKEVPVDERRRAKRVIVQESFSLFLVIPNVQGMVRLYMRDLSRLGLCFQTEIATDFKADQLFTLRLYINPSFFLPIEARVVRVHNGEIACEFSDPKAKPVLAVATLLDFLDLATDIGEVVR